MTGASGRSPLKVMHLPVRPRAGSGARGLHAWSQDAFPLGGATPNTLRMASRYW